MSELPPTWEMVPIGNVTVECLQGIPSRDKEFQYIDIASVDRDTKSITNPQKLLGKDAPSRARQHVRAGDVLVSMTRPNLNAVALVPDSLDGQIASTGFDVLRAPELDPRWLFYLARTRTFVDRMSELVQGALYPAVRSKDVRGFEAPLAPLNEQKRIADKLDAVLARVDACREHLDRVPAILKRFRQAVLAAAISARLTEEWRSQVKSKIDSGTWGKTVLVNLCQLGRVITYGVIKLGNEVSDGVPCLRTSNVRWLRIDTDGIKRIAPSLSAEYSRTILEGSEVLVNVRGTLGGVAVAASEMRGWNVSREVAVVPVDASKAAPAFLALWIASDRSQNWLSDVEKGVAYIGINIEDLRNLPVELPPMKEQHEIVRRVETLFAYADRLEARYTAARARIERLTPALLAKAFRGELVPQDPNDEPPAVMLERIRAARAAEGDSKPRHGRSKVIPGTRKTKVEDTMFKRTEIAASHLADILRGRGRLTAEALWSASQLDIDDFYDQLKDEEARGLLREVRRKGGTDAARTLEVAA